MGYEEITLKQKRNLSTMAAEFPQKAEIKSNVMLKYWV